jgi:transposase InsO family protein
VIKALQRALNNEKPTGRVLHHSDRGSQYASNDYQQLLQEHHFSSEHVETWELLRQRLYGVVS